MAQLTLEDGGRLWYEDIGRGPVLVGVHGWAMSGTLFAPQHRLAGDFRVITPDLRGHGRSSPLPAGGGVATLAADLATLCERLSLERVCLIGWSMGAMVVWRLLAGRAAGRIAAVVVEDMSPRILNDHAWSLGLLGGHDAVSTARLIELMQADWPAYTNLFVPRIFAAGCESTQPPLIEMARMAALRADPASMARLWADMARQDLRDIVRRIAVPALIAHGSASQLYPPAVSDWLARHMADAERVCFARSGHAPHLEEPDRFNRLVADFVLGTSPADVPQSSPAFPAEAAAATPAKGDSP